MAQVRHAGRALAAFDEHARAGGLEHRGVVPRSAHGRYVPWDRDPVAILDAQNESRLPDLVPLRMQRMAADPFSFYRGTAGIMAADLKRGISSHLDVVSCGDAHISNFGFFASPLRTLMFDLNDFDEAAVAPFEWDVKRLVTSVIIAARQNGHSAASGRRAALAAAAAYRTTLGQMAELTALQRYYARLDVDLMRRGLDASTRRVLDRSVAQAKRRTSESFVAKVTTIDDDGRRMFVDDPPLLSHAALDNRVDVERLFEEYRRTVSPDVAMLLAQHELTDTVRRVVGVGSVGTRCYLVLLTGPRRGSIVLQIKEAQKSVIGRRAQHEGRRVVANQRILQAVSDVFLGQLRSDGRDYYVRQFRDMKGSIDVGTLTPAQLATYATGCGTVLARAHAQSPQGAAVVGYLGRSDKFDRAVVAWGTAYADQSLADYERFVAAVGGHA
jgi:uncharacterized protein (DUF2252 family)